MAVPMTLQPVVVLLAGAILGSRGGAASQATYLLAGAAGLPVFAAGGGAAYLLGPTGGYLLAFPVAAAVAGLWHPGRGGWVRGAVCLGASLAIIHLGGIAWLTIVADGSVAVGNLLRPFLVGDALKILFVLAVVRLGPEALRGRSA
jgi:biotin transport system substrate-specific component